MERQDKVKLRNKAYGIRKIKKEINKIIELLEKDPNTPKEEIKEILKEIKELNFNYKILNPKELERYYIMLTVNREDLIMELLQRDNNLYWDLNIIEKALKNPNKYLYLAQVFL